MNAPTGEKETGISRTAAVAAGSRTLHPVGFEQRLLDKARALGLGPEDRLVIGFSGGRDSLALAGAMRWVERRLGTRPIMLHVDHGLRPTSGEEAGLAAALADSLGLPFEHHRVTGPPREVHRGLGLEEAARRERYALLHGAAARLRARAIVTAHHRQDQAETVLLHLLRGGGLHGARAMAEIGVIPTPLVRKSHDISHEITPMVLWRPLLDEPPVEIDRYVKHLGLTPIADESNDDLTLRRNAIRHRVLPLLEETVPGAEEALARYAALAAEDDALLAALCERAVLDATGAGGEFVAASLHGQPEAMQRRMVRRWLDMTTAAPPISMSRTDAVIALAMRNVGGKSVEIGEGWTVRLTRGMLHGIREARTRYDYGSGGLTMTVVEPRAAGVVRILIDDASIRSRTAEMARELDQTYGEETPLLVGVLNGAVTFMTDLMRAMTIPLEIDFMAVSSYGAATKSSGVVRILKDLDQEIEGRRVVVVEDIVDSGLTLQYLLDVLERRNPRDIRVVALLKKTKPDAVPIHVDQVGFTIPDEFVVGYGLDYAGKYRNLPYVAVLDPSMYVGE